MSYMDMTVYVISYGERSMIHIIRGPRTLCFDVQVLYYLYLGAWYNVPVPGGSGISSYILYSEYWSPISTGTLQ